LQKSTSTRFTKLIVVETKAHLKGTKKNQMPESDIYTAVMVQASRGNCHSLIKPKLKLSITKSCHREEENKNPMLPLLFRR
jgi:hypothetical protein